MKKLLTPSRAPRALAMVVGVLLVVAPDTVRAQAAAPTPASAGGAAPQAKGDSQVPVLKKNAQQAQSANAEAAAFNNKCGTSVESNRLGSQGESQAIGNAAAENTQKGVSWDCTGTLGQMAGMFKRNGDAREANKAACGEFPQVKSACDEAVAAAEATKKMMSQGSLQADAYQYVDLAACKKVPATKSNLVSAQSSHLKTQQKTYDVSTGLLKCAALGGLGAGLAGLVSKMMEKKPEDKEEEEDSGGSGGGGGGEPATAGPVLPSDYTEGQNSDVAIPDSLKSTALNSNDSEGNPTDSTPTGNGTVAVVKPADGENYEAEGFGANDGQGLMSSSSSAASNLAAVGAVGAGSGGGADSGGLGAASSSSGDGTGNGGSGKLLGAMGGFGSDSDGGSSKNSSQVVNEVTNYNSIPRPNNGRLPASGAGNARAGKAAVVLPPDCAVNSTAARCQVGQQILRDPLLNSAKPH